MQSYTFDQLDEYGQENAITRYRNDALIEAFVLEHYKNATSPLLAWGVEAIGWRFTIHGERVA